MKIKPRLLCEGLARKNTDVVFQVKFTYFCIVALISTEMLLRVSTNEQTEWYLWIMWGLQTTLSLIAILLITKWPSLNDTVNACGCIIMHTIWAVQSALIEDASTTTTSSCTCSTSSNGQTKESTSNSQTTDNSIIRSPASIGYMIGILCFIMVLKCRNLYLKTSMIIFNTIIYFSLSGADIYQIHFLILILIAAWLNLFWEEQSTRRSEWAQQLIENQPYSMIVVSQQKSFNKPDVPKTELIASNSQARRLLDIPISSSSKSWGTSYTDEFLEVCSRIVMKKRIIETGGGFRRRHRLQSNSQKTESVFFNGSNKIDGGEFDEDYFEEDSDPFEKEPNKTLKNLLRIRFKHFSQNPPSRQESLNFKSPEISQPNQQQNNNNNIHQHPNLSEQQHHHFHSRPLHQQQAQGQFSPEQVGIQPAGVSTGVISKDYCVQRSTIHKFMTSTAPQVLNKYEKIKSSMTEEFNCELHAKEQKDNNQNSNNGSSNKSQSKSLRISLHWILEPEGLCSIISFHPMKKFKGVSSVRVASELEEEFQEELKPINNSVKKEINLNERAIEEKKKWIFYEEFCKQALLKSTIPVGNVVQELKALMNRSSQITESDLARFLITTQMGTSQSILDVGAMTSQTKQSTTNSSNKGVYCIPKRQMENILQLAILASTITSNFVNYFAIKELQNIQIDDRAFSLSKVFKNIQHIFQKQLDRKNILVLFDQKESAALTTAKRASSSAFGFPFLTSTAPLSTSSIQSNSLQAQSQSMTAIAHGSGNNVNANLNSNVLSGNSATNVNSLLIGIASSKAAAKLDEMINNQSMVQHLLFNLFQNAVDNTPARGRIAVQIARDPFHESYVRIRIRNEFANSPESNLQARSLSWRSMLKQFEETGNFYFGTRMATKLSELVGPFKSITFSELSGLEMQVELVITDHSKKNKSHLDESSYSMSSQQLAGGGNKQAPESSSLQHVPSSLNQSSDYYVYNQQHQDPHSQFRSNRHRSSSLSSYQVRDSCDSFDKWIKIQTIDAQKPSNTLRIRNQLKYKE